MSSLTSKASVTNATPVIRAFFYQFCVALDRCFLLQRDQSVHIEEFGDVSTNDEQIEVKHRDSKLDISSHSFWNTLRNWCRDEFDETKFSSLILWTTEKIDKNSKLYKWNNLKTKEKRDTIEQYIEAYKTKPKKDDQLFKLMSAVQSTDPVRLKSILSKTAIAANNPKDEILLKQIKEVHCKFIFEELQENFLYGLLGFIEHKQKRNSGWEITYDEFTAKVQELTNLYRTKSVVFPKVEALSLAEEKYLDSLFVKKIREIEYDDEILDAMTYYHKTMQFISNECIKYRVPKYAIESYSENLKEDFKIKYKIASRKSNVSDLIQCSQNFYDEIKSASAPQFYEFLQTPLFFKNGVMHLLMDDKKDGLKWLLKI